MEWILFMPQIKKIHRPFSNKVAFSQSYGFSSSHV